MGQLVDFFAGDAHAIGLAISKLDYESLRDPAKYPLHVDFSLHLSPTDFDILTELASRAVGSGPSSLSDSLADSVGGDGRESWAYVVAESWVDTLAALEESHIPKLAAAWVDGLAKEYGDSSLGVTPEMLEALGALALLCRQARQSGLPVVHTWAL